MPSIAESQVGLFSRADLTPIPLLGVNVRAEILGHSSRVTMQQRFRNVEKQPVEVVYLFPVPESAAVCGLTVRMGDRAIEAEVAEREKAFERYDDAMSAGQGAVLLDMERPSILTLSVGNLLPDQEACVELRWVADLAPEGDAIRFMLPTTIAPRHAPVEDRQGISPTPAERVTPPVQLDVSYGLQLEADILLGSPIRTVESPSHPVRVELDGTRARVTLSHDEAAMDRDFVLLVTPQDHATARVLVEANDDGLTTAAVSLVPQLPTSDTGREVVFLVDRSGSMAGSSIEQVRAALQLCLRSLREGDRFNIVGFGSDFSLLFPESVDYAHKTLDAASRHVDGLDADMGGTEILPALQAVLERKPARGFTRQVVLLTDGEVTNDEAVVALAEKHRDETRIFTFGIGYGASEHLVRSVARVTMGQAEFIHPGERIEPKVLRQFARLDTPALRDVKVEVQGADVTLQAPHRPTAVFNGEAMVLYARLASHGPVTFTVSGTAGGDAVRWSVPVDIGAAQRGEMLATLAARAAIRDLEEGTSALHATVRGSAQAGRRQERIRKEIVALATAYHLASTETSFVAIERRDAVADQPAAQLRRVPVALTAGYGGTEARSTGRPHASSTAAFALSPAAPAVAPRLGSRLLSALRLRALTPDEHAEADLCCCDASAERLATGAPSVNATSSPSFGPHVALARLQQADGSWRLDGELASVLGVELKALRDAANGIAVKKNAEALVATRAALRCLETRAADARVEWRMLAMKAERWLAHELAGFAPGVAGQLHAAVAALLP